MGIYLENNRHILLELGNRLIGEIKRSFKNLTYCTLILQVKNFNKLHKCHDLICIVIEAATNSLMEDYKQKRTSGKKFE